jgi:hypothetical protein
MTIHVYGIRHHGPGCARSLRIALDQLQPDAIVMEGPGDAEDVLPQCADPTMKPPVALLVYPQDEPAQAAFFPFAVFSPEWQTLQWSTARRVPIKLMDLPQKHALAIDREQQSAEGPVDSNPSPEDAATDVPHRNGLGPASEPSAPDAEHSTDEQTTDETPAWNVDPIAQLAQAAGFADHELWWETQIERRQEPGELFRGILEAMHAVRAELPETRDRALLREAHMRRTVRRVRKEGFEKIAVICGAWHAPVLDEDAIAGKRAGCTNKEDELLLKGLPTIKTSAAWIPWTHSRLSYRSGYGAGVSSPGWYAHLWEHHDRHSARWLSTAARLLREHDLDASSASVVEAVRLADALAALRGLQAAGLTELNDAIVAVLCRGDWAQMRLIHKRLEVGDVLGEVPPDSPQVPLARDLASLEKSLRLKRSTEIRTLTLDLRKEIDLARSHLFHRLGLLGIEWAECKQTGGKVSTFGEVWQIEWQPESEVALIEASVWGLTVETAAAAKSVSMANDASDLPTICALLNAAVLAGLEQAVGPILARLQSQAAIAADVRHLMDALLPLARVARYSDVRGTQASSVEPILEGLFERAVVGLPSASSSLDDDAVEQMVRSMASVQEALGILQRENLSAEWYLVLRRFLESTVNPLLRGWSCRSLLERGLLEDETFSRLTRLALSSANPPAQAAGWLAGLLRGSGLLLLHQDRLWQVVDRWLCELSGDMFTETLPVLRRSFADFSGPERRQMADKIKRPLDGAARPERSASPDGPDINLDRARLAFPVLVAILGVADPSRPAERSNA